MNQKTQLLKNTIIIALGKLGTQIVSFLLLPLYTSKLTTEEYGTYDFLVTLSVFLLPIITLLIEESMFRFLIDAEISKEKKKIITSSILYMLFGTIVFSLIAWLYTTISGYEYGLLFIIFVISNVLVSISNSLSRGMGKIKAYSASNFILGALTIVLNIFFIAVLNMQAKGLLWANTIANTITAIIVLFALKAYKFINKHNFSRKRLREMVKYSFPLVPNNLSWIIISLSDRLMLTWITGSDQNGIYSVANRFPNIIYTCYGFFSTAWKESAARIVKEENSVKYYNNIYKDMKNFLKAITIGLIAIMPFAFSLFIKESYSAAYSYIPILSIGIYYANMSNFYGGIFTAFKNTKIMGSTTAIGAIINVGINIIFMKIYPENGILIATLSTLISTLIVYIYRRAKLRKHIILKERFNLTYWSLLALTLCSYYINNKIFCAGVLIVDVFYCYFTNRDFLLGTLKSVKGKFKK